ncbi:MAG: hypothetical protein KKB81_02520 [Candidatus Margulisbacteria bacterium]|nr:hypothetical protein [Candidatus Margulisiibacteriota bacterium]MBU1021064.1 hypothetical protein [Candidatus Margulisiibacteriota bacterium]MBU1729739.1 hypothetical protein [Candidatus Margulisiibacteriota bacterium]MBU1956004.1 hypothetical protein [Candidatus Margulisiibacteriota bacterium]
MKERVKDCVSMLRKDASRNVGVGEIAAKLEGMALQAFAESRAGGTRIVAGDLVKVAELMVVGAEVLGKSGNKKSQAYALSHAGKAYMEAGWMLEGKVLIEKATRMFLELGILDQALNDSIYAGIKCNVI